MAPFSGWPTTWTAYLVPNLPFRRRASSSTTTPTTTSTRSSTTGKPIFPPSHASSYLPGHASILRCTRCLAHLCSTSQIISKGFTGRYGKAYLVCPPSTSSSAPTDPFAQLGSGPDLPNTSTHKPMPRQLVTGPHVVSDISCTGCGSILGWKYVAADEEAQRYKVGKVILETRRVCRSELWEYDLERFPPLSPGGSSLGTSRRGSAQTETDSDGEKEECLVEFDSQDEDECEDLFMGIWSEALAKKRRRASAWKKEK